MHVVIPCFSTMLNCHYIALTSLQYYFSIHAYLINFGTEQGRRNYMPFWIYIMTSADTDLSFPMYILVLTFLLLKIVYYVDLWSAFVEQKKDLFVPKKSILRKYDSNRNITWNCAGLFARSPVLYLIIPEK